LRVDFGARRPGAHGQDDVRSNALIAVRCAGTARPTALSTRWDSAPYHTLGALGQRALPHSRPAGTARPTPLSARWDRAPYRALGALGQRALPHSRPAGTARPYPRGRTRKAICRSWQWAEGVHRSARRRAILLRAARAKSASGFAFLVAR